MPLDFNVVAFPKGNHEDDPFAKYNTPQSPILFPVAERKAGWQMRDGAYMPVNSHKALVRVDPRDHNKAYVINFVASTYKLVHNRELFDVVEKGMINHYGLEGCQDVQVTDRVADYGRFCYREYIFPNIRCRIGGAARSDIGFRIIAQNGYGGGSIRLYAGAIEFYCTNGMIRGLHHSAYKRHTSGCQIYHLDKMVKGSLQTFTNAQDDWHRWAHTTVSNANTLEFFRSIARSPSLLDKLNEHYIREREVRGPTMWTVYSTLTYFASHADGDFAPRRGDVEDGRVASTMHDRELDVAKWVESARFKALAETG